MTSRPGGVLPVTPNSVDLAPNAATPSPSAAIPRLSNSRTAAALLGMRVLNRKVSTAVNSCSVSMICRRS